MLVKPQISVRTREIVPLLSVLNGWFVTAAGHHVPPLPTVTSTAVDIENGFRVMLPRRRRQARIKLPFILCGRDMV